MADDVSRHSAVALERGRGCVLFVEKAGERDHLMLLIVQRDKEVPDVHKVAERRPDRFHGLQERPGSVRGPGNPVHGASEHIAGFSPGDIRQDALKERPAIIRASGDVRPVFDPADAAVLCEDPVLLNVLRRLRFPEIPRPLPGGRQVFPEDDLLVPDLSGQELFGRVSELSDVFGDIGHRKPFSVRPFHEHRRAPVDNRLEIQMTPHDRFACSIHRVRSIPQWKTNAIGEKTGKRAGTSCTPALLPGDAVPFAYFAGLCFLLRSASSRALRSFIFATSFSSAAIISSARLLGMSSTLRRYFSSAASIFPCFRRTVASL